LYVGHLRTSTGSASAATAAPPSFSAGAQQGSLAASPGTPGGSTKAAAAAVGANLGRAMSSGLVVSQTGSFPSSCASPPGIQANGAGRQRFSASQAVAAAPHRASTGQVPAHTSLHRMLIKKEQEQALQATGVMGIHLALAGGAGESASPVCHGSVMGSQCVRVVIVTACMVLHAI
jgi:hypothetical protein